MKQLFRLPAGVLRGKDHPAVIGRDGAGAGAVDPGGLDAGDPVEPALFPQQLPHRPGGRRYEDFPPAAFPEGALHRLGHRKADAVRGPGDKPGKQPGESGRPDLRHRHRPALGDRHHLLGDDEDIAFFEERPRRLRKDGGEVVPLMDQRGFEGEPPPADASHPDHLRPVEVDIGPRDRGFPLDGLDFLLLGKG